MPTIKSKIDPSSPTFAANAEQMRAVVAELHAHTARVAEGGGKPTIQEYLVQTFRDKVWLKVSSELAAALLASAPVFVGAAENVGNDTTGVTGQRYGETAKPGSYISGLKQLPRNVRVVEPRYPESALSKGIEGEVTVEFVLSPEGRPTNITITKSEPNAMFTAAIEEVFAKWLFLPDFNNVCASVLGRMQQQIYFRVVDGKARISINPVNDMGRHSTANEAKQDFMSLKEAKLRYKSLSNMRYPVDARKAGARGIVVSTMRILPDGSVTNVEHRFALPDQYFKEAVVAHLKKTEFVSLDGAAPNKQQDVCLDFIFDLS